MLNEKTIEQIFKDNEKQMIELAHKNIDKAFNKFNKLILLILIISMIPFTFGFYISFQKLDKGVKMGQIEHCGKLYSIKPLNTLIIGD